MLDITNEYFNYFWNKLNIPMFTTDELDLMLSYNNPIIDNLTLEADFPIYHSYFAAKVRKIIDKFKDNLDDYLNNFNTTQMENTLQRRSYGYTEVMQTHNETVDDVAEFEFIVVRHFLRKASKHYRTYNNRNVCLDFFTYQSQIDGSSSVVIEMVVNNHCYDPKKGYLLEAIEEDRKLPEAEELYKLITEFEYGLLGVEELYDCIMSKYNFYFDEIKKYKALNIKFCEVKMTDNMEVNRLFMEAGRRLFEQYKDDIFNSAQFGMLKNIFYGPEEMTVKFHYNTCVGSNFITMVIERKKQKVIWVYYFDVSLTFPSIIKIDKVNAFVVYD